MVDKISLFLRQYRVYYVALIVWCMYKVSQILTYMMSEPMISLAEWQLVGISTALVSFLSIVGVAASKAANPVLRDDRD